MISWPSADSKIIPELAVPNHLRFPPSTSISVMFVVPNKYSTFPSNSSLIRCALYSPGIPSNAVSDEYSTAKPLSVPIHISLSKSTAKAFTSFEGRAPVFCPVLSCTHSSSPGLSIVPLSLYPYMPTPFIDNHLLPL